MTARTVLVVEPAGRGRDVLLDALRAEGVAAHAADDAIAAITLMPELNPDVVVVGHDVGALGAEGTCGVLRHASPTVATLLLLDVGEHASGEPDAVVYRSGSVGAMARAIVAARRRPDAIAVEETPEPPASSRRHTEPPAAIDARLESIEAHVTHGEWADVAREVAACGPEDALPPKLALLYAVARKETPGADDKGDADALAIRALASLLGMPESSAIAIALGKRLVRRPPAARREAPPPRTSALLIAAAFAVGIACGYMFFLRGLVHG